MTETIVLFKLILAHIFADFFFQSDKWVKHKKEHKQKSKYLYVHAFLHAAISYLIIFDFSAWLIPVIIFVSHSIIDIIKTYYKDKLKYFIVDQLAHLVVILIIWVFIFNSWNKFINEIEIYLSNPKLWLILIGYALCLYPIGFIIGKATKKWQKEISSDTSEGLPKAGMYIGFLERILIFTFIIISQFQAIGFLLAAKSIFRFGDLKNSDDRKRTEYILIGTFLSFVLTIGLGLVIKHFLS